MINLKPFFHGHLVIVLSLDKKITGFIINILPFWGIKEYMVGSAGREVYTATAHTLNNVLIVNTDFNDMVNEDSIFS